MTEPNADRMDDAGRLPPSSGESEPSERLGWLVDAVAHVKTSVHVKLLAGFMVGAVKG